MVPNEEAPVSKWPAGCTGPVYRTSVLDGGRQRLTTAPGEATQTVADEQLQLQLQTHSFTQV
jgi:hypothetical protein